MHKEMAAKEDDERESADEGGLSAEESAAMMIEASEIIRQEGAVGVCWIAIGGTVGCLSRAVRDPAFARPGRDSPLCRLGLVRVVLGSDRRVRESEGDH